VKILVLTNLFPNPLQPHLAPWNRAQLRPIAARHELRVIAPVLWIEEWKAWRKGRQPMPADRRSICDEIPIEHPRYYYPPKVMRSAYGEFFRHSVASAFQRAMHEARPDVVYASWAYPDGWAAVRLARQAGLPVVVKVHGTDVLSLEQYPGRLHRTLEGLQQADRIVAVSEHLAESLRNYGIAGPRIVVVRNGVDTLRFCPGSRRAARNRLRLAQEEQHILFVGNLVPVKQVDVLLQACARLRQRGIRFRCHLIGDGPLRSNLRSTIERLGLSGCVALQGTIPHEQLVDWYRAANVVALPSRSEGIPNVLLEATACGTPFVASRVGGISEIETGGQCQLVPPENVETLADALEKTLTSKEPHGQAVRQRSLSWEESSRALESVLWSVVPQTTTDCAEIC
jgi:glycosyltransferase involved in cell wall biosynthesis